MMPFNFGGDCELFINGQSLGKAHVTLNFKSSEEREQDADLEELMRRERLKG
jgi:hypothetical protein